MKPILVIPAMFRSPMLDACLSYVINSDYDGDIMVTSADDAVSYVESVSDRITFYHAVRTDGSSIQLRVITSTIPSIDSSYDTIYFMHNDVLVHDHWYSDMVRGWEYGSDNVWCICSPYTWYEPVNNIPGYYDKACTMSPGEIRSTYRSYEGLRCAYTPVDGQILGPGIDMRNSKANNPVMVRFSVLTSYKREWYMRSLDKYGGESDHLTEIYMLLDGIDNRKLNLWVKGDPVIHVTAYDSSYIPIDDINEGVNEAYRIYTRNVGYNLEHLVTIWNKYLCAKYKDEMSIGIASNDFNSIYHIIDEASDMIHNITCDTCPASHLCMASGNKHHPHPWIK